MKNCYDTKSQMHLALFQVRMMPLGPGIPSHATPLFNWLTSGIMLVINRVPISTDNDDEHFKALVKRQTKMTTNMILPETILFFP